MSELIKFKVCNYNDEKLDTFTFNRDKDNMKITIKNKKINVEVDADSDFGRFFRSKV